MFGIEEERNTFHQIYGTYLTTRRHIIELSNLHSHHHENLKYKK
jgi:hypothetical protein